MRCCSPLPLLAVLARREGMVEASMLHNDRRMLGQNTPYEDSDFFLILLSLILTQTGIDFYCDFDCDFDFGTVALNSKLQI